MDPNPRLEFFSRTVFFNLAYQLRKSVGATYVSVKKVGDFCRRISHNVATNGAKFKFDQQTLIEEDNRFAEDCLT